MIPPTVLKLSNRDETAAAVAATTIEVMITILWMVSRFQRMGEAPTLSGLGRKMSPLLRVVDQLLGVGGSLSRWPGC